MEMDVLAGSRSLIDTHRPAMIVEYVKSDPNALREWLEALDYQVLVSGLNFLAIHRSDPSLANIRIKS